MTAPVSPPAAPVHLPGVEGLRGVAALAVLTGHVLVIMPAHGGLTAPWLGPVAGLCLRGVILFFVLSGFLLYRPYARSLLAGSPLPSAGTYARHRFLRIWPAHFVVLLAAGPVLGVAYAHALRVGDPLDPTERLGHLLDPVLLLLNATLLQGFVPAGVRTGLGVSWSLVAEVTFYASLPVLALAAVRLRRGVPGILTAASPVLLLLATGVCTRLAVAVLLGKPPVGGATGVASSWDVKSTGHSWVAVLADGMLCNADLFALGMGIAVALVAVEEARLGPAAIRVLRRLFGLALVLAPLCFLVVVAATDSALLSAPVFGAACTGLIALILLPGGGWFVRSAERLLGTATLRYLGRISYSVYLWHLPVMLFLLVHRPGLRYSSYPTLVGDYALVCVLTLALAALTYHVVEAPALRLKGPAVQRSTPRRSLREAEEAA